MGTNALKPFKGSFFLQQLTLRLRCLMLAVLPVIAAEPSELRKAWMWNDRPGVAKMLNDVADSMAAAGFHDQAADLFERLVVVQSS